MISARRDAFLAAASDISVSTALAASSARLFSAALAPITSDAVPISATASAIQRREKGSCLRFITVRFLLSMEAARSFGRAKTFSGLRGFAGWRCHHNCEQFAAPQQAFPQPATTDPAIGTIILRINR